MRAGIRCFSQANEGAEIEPLLVRAARGQKTNRAPCWMMRQAGRYMKQSPPAPSSRSEETELIVETTLQPFDAFKPDGVILFSDILTPLPALGVDFYIDDVRGPILDNTIRTKDDLSVLKPIELSQLDFVGKSLGQIKKHTTDNSPTGERPAVLGFVGSPWTLATYVVEGKSSKHYLKIKQMAFESPDVLKALLQHLADQIALYVDFQISAGADAIQLFDSWGGQLPPADWEVWSKPFITHIVNHVQQAHPNVPLTLYANGSGGLLERLKSTGVSVIGVDWTVDMKDARDRLGSDVALQGNIDPATLFTTQQNITNKIEQCLKDAGKQGHILNLGHGVFVGTPEENVAHFFNESKRLTYDQL